MRDISEATSGPHPNPLLEGEGTKPVGVIETDLFCDHCGFNLHTQRVWRDERLGILVCRCPECGRHQAAGERSTAASKWLQRLALVGAVIWVGLSLAFVIGVFFFAVGIHVAAEEGLTYRRFETEAGLPVESNWNSSTQIQQYQLADVPDGKVVPVDGKEVVMRRRIAPWLPMSGTVQSPQVFTMGRPSSPYEAGFAAFFLYLGWYFCAVLLAAGSWFWRRPWRAVWVLLPVLAAFLVWMLMRLSQQNMTSYWGSVRSVDETPVTTLLIMTAGLNVLVLAAGLVSGRPIVRFLLKVFCPPRLRQVFAFMWHCDGKALPSLARPDQNS